MICARSIAASALRPAAVARPVAAVHARSLRTRGPATPAVASEAGHRMRTLETMPFQTYQFALDLIRRDHAEKLGLIAKQRARVAAAAAAPEPDSPAARVRMRDLSAHLDHLRVQADINNPRVKYNFDRGISARPPPRARTQLTRAPQSACTSPSTDSCSTASGASTAGPC